MNICLFSSLAIIGVCSVPHVASSQPARPPLFKKWGFPQDALFFKENAKADWFGRPEEQREWLAPAGLTPDVFKAIDTTNIDLAFKRGAYESITNSSEGKRIREAALNTLKIVVRAEWLPAPELVSPARFNRKPPSPSYEVAYCAFTRGEVRGLYMISPNREFWLYLEQPFPMDAKSQPISLPDVLLPEMLKEAGRGSRPAIRAREFVRYRASLPVGPFQPVRIVLIHCELPQSLGFANFGYVGQLKP